jgi:hypothetical protein
MIRPPFDSASKTAISENPPEKRTDSGTVDCEEVPLDPDLAKIIIAWPQLSKDIRAAVPHIGGIL